MSESERGKATVTEEMATALIDELDKRWRVFEFTDLWRELDGEEQVSVMRTVLEQVRGEDPLVAENERLRLIETRARTLCHALEVGMGRGDSISIARERLRAALSAPEKPERSS